MWRRLGHLVGFDRRTVVGFVRRTMSALIAADKNSTSSALAAGFIPKVQDLIRDSLFTGLTERNGLSFEIE